MQHQRAHSKIHNFYLERTQSGLWRCHWFVTDSRTDAKLVSKLLPGPEAEARRPAGMSKGAVDPRVRWALLLDEMSMPLFVAGLLSGALGLPGMSSEAVPRWESLVDNL